MLAGLAMMAMALGGGVEREVEFAGAGGLMLKGTLRLPADGPTAAPAFVLLPGSGPTDRNGNQLPSLRTDLLKELADKMAAMGVATLRFDKRATPGYAAHWPKDQQQMNEFFSWRSFVGDAKAAMDLLRKTEGVDGKKVGILGHSEGGSIALQLGADLSAQEKPSSMILMGTAGRNMAVILREQVQAALVAQQAPEPVQTQLMGQVDVAIESVKTEGKVPQGLHPGLAPLFNPSAISILQSYFKLDAPAMAAAYPGPVLIMNGEYDFQISADKDAPVLLKAFQDRQTGSVKVVISPKTSHNFKAVQQFRDMGFEGPVVESAVSAIHDFVKRLP